jgi:hypothetical protein
MVQGVTPRSMNLVRGGDWSSGIRIYRGFRLPKRFWISSSSGSRTPPDTHLVNSQHQIVFRSMRGGFYHPTSASRRIGRPPAMILTRRSKQHLSFPFNATDSIDDSFPKRITVYVTVKMDLCL